ncbi:MAG: zinc metalloprotease HtpX [Candidatus Diapherotrites archaeon]|nr:zinc metalloprotease HtpX [Candidatus Diapherotrites archaeon]
MGLYEQIESNKRRTFLLFAVFFAVVIAVGYAVGWLFWDFGELGVAFSIMLGTFWALVTYFLGDRIVLAVSGAREVRKEEFPHLYNTVEGLAIAAGLPAPKVYVMNDPAPNAFATGRNPNNSVIAVTTGLLKIMNRQELEGVVAHEMSHIKNRDVALQVFASILVGVVVMIADMAMRTMFYSRNRDKDKSPALMLVGVLFIFLAPIVAQLIHMAISRQREFLADASGAMLTRYPEGLAAALEKISANPNQLRAATNATAHLFIVNPFKKGFLVGLFSTHPPLEERITRLRERSMGMQG